MRQVAILDVQGRIAVHTGSKCVPAAGHAMGPNCCAQANMMARDTVWKEMANAFESARGEMADRLLAAVDAAEQQGGDVRGRQSASLIVVSGKASHPAGLDRSVDLRVDDHPDPVGELRRLLGYTRAHERAEQAIGKAVANDGGGALADLDACCAAYPDEPEFLFRRALVLLMLARIDEATELLRKAHAIHPGWSEVLLRFADAGVIPAGREVLEPLVARCVAQSKKRDSASIRELSRGDLDALLEAYRDLHPDDDPLPARAELERLWNGICADPRLVYIGAFDGPRLVATCTAAIVPNLTRGARPYAVIENVWTHPASRRQGLGSAALQELLGRCWAAGCYKAMLLSASHRGAAHEFYQRNGFDKHAKQGFIVRK
jgi:GNAT superfamily N-acetyltransferase